VGHQFAKALSTDTPNIDIAKIMSRLTERLDCTSAALREATKQRDAAEGTTGNFQLTAARARIAELEARQVNLRQFDEFAICHFGASEDYAKGYIDAQNNAKKAIAAAGIGIKKE